MVLIFFSFTLASDYPIFNIPDMNVSPTHFLNNIPPSRNSLFLAPTDRDEVINLCASLKVDSSLPYDDIKPAVVTLFHFCQLPPVKPAVVKAVKHLIAYPLVHIFNLSTATGIVPDQLKLVKVVPIYKSGDSDLCNNYRPISVLPVCLVFFFFFSKIFERIIHKRLRHFLTRNSLLHSSQFGFRKNFSSYMAVLEAYNNIVSHLDKGEHTAGIFLDLSKAFDTISHDILVTKLQHYGVHGSALNWFRNYLYCSDWCSPGLCAFYYIY